MIQPRTARTTRRESRACTSVLAFSIVLIVLLILPAGVLADDYVGGLPLTTVQTGTVTGDLYIAGNPPSSEFIKTVDRTFTLPAAAVAASGRIKWARLYVSAYCGHMQDLKAITYTTKVDWNNDATWDSTWTETDTGHVFNYLQGGDYGGGGNDNSGFAGHGAGEPYLMINNHTNRVTSDYFSWYDVKDLIQVGQPTINVNVDATGSYDGRIKVVTLVVAYDDPASATETTYWVNQGHDVCSYYTEDYEATAAVGTTEFDTTGVTGITSATLISDYMASNNGNYGFPTAENSFSYTGLTPPVTGVFTNANLDRSGANQGPYSGNRAWDVTSSVTGSGPVTLGYARYFPGTGTAAFYKIPLAFLVVKKPLAVPPPVAAFSGTPISGTAPLIVQFTDESTNNPTSWAWTFGDGGTSTLKNPSNTYTTAGTYTVTLTATNTGGSDDEVKTGYITVTSATGGLAESASPKYQTDARNTGQSQFTGPQTATLAWSYTPSGAIPQYGNGPSLGSDGTLYLGTGTQLTALYPTGTIRWSYTAGGTVSDTPAVAEDGTIYVGSADSKLHAINPDGTFKWSYTTGSNLQSSPAIGCDGTIYVGSNDNKLYAINTDGSLKWSYTTGGAVKPSPAIGSDGTIYVGSSDNKLYAINADGSLKWSSATGSGLYNGPSIGPDGTLYVGAYGTKILYAFNPDGTSKWTYTAGGYIASTPAIGSDGTIYVTAGDGYLYAINTDGTLKWKTQAANSWGFYYGSPAIGADGTIYTGNYQQKVYAVNPDGTVKWSSTATGKPLYYHSPVIGPDGTLYIAGSGSGTSILYAFRDPAPVAGFSGTPTSGTAPLIVQFTDESTNVPTYWLWDFGDGTSSTVQNPDHEYTAAGTYTVSLTAANTGGSDDETKTGYISVAAAPQVDLTITGVVNMVPTSGSAVVFAKEPNAVQITGIQNSGTATATTITVALYASDVSGGLTPVATGTIGSLAGGAQTSLTLIDPTIRAIEGGTVTYTVRLDPENLIAETNEENNDKESGVKSVMYNGYKGKRYWDGGSDIGTKYTYDLNGDVIYYTQPASAYKGVGWTTRTETWTAANLPVPAGATVEKVYLYISYNWDSTSGGAPGIAATFNGNTIALGTPYTDKSNFGFYGTNKYGLFPAIDVSSLFINGGNNTLVMTPDPENSQALYPSTLVVIYSDPARTRKQIFINEECDELAYSESGYGTTMDEATAYAPFTGLAIDTGNVQSATLHSFAGNAGPDEGNLLFNGAMVATSAWQGTSSTASAQSFDVKSHLTATGNVAGIQATQSGGMVALQQVLVVEYTPAVVAPVAAFSGTPTFGAAPMNVVFTDESANTPTGWAWTMSGTEGIDYEYTDSTSSTSQNPHLRFLIAGTYDVTLTASNTGGSDSETKTGYITVGSGLLPFPGETNPPTDPDSDGFYENLNGDAFFNFADVQRYFKEMDWIAVNQPTAFFDYNSDEYINFADAQRLFKEL